MITERKTLYNKLVMLALPIMGANFLQTLYTLADTYFLGFLGKEAVSAPTISFPIILFVILFGMGFSLAGTTLISQSKGKGDQESIDFYASQVTSMMMLISLVISIVGILFTHPFLRLMQVPEDVYPLVFSYLRIIFYGIPFMFLSFILRGLLQGVGNSMTPFRVQLITIALNIGLDPLLIFGIGPFPELGVAGAAVATVFSRFVSSVIALKILLDGKQGLRIRKEFLKPRKKAVILISRIGFPTALGQGVSALGFIILQGVVNMLGAAVIAAYGIGNRIVSIFNMPAMGFSQATAVMVGQELGAKRPEDAKWIVNKGVFTILIFIGIGMTLTFFFGQSLVRIFIDDAEVIALGGEMFRIMSIAVVFFSLFRVLTGAFQGGGDTKPIMVMDILRLWGLRLPIAYFSVLALGAGAAGIWWSMLISNSIMAIMSLILYNTGRWTRKLQPDEI